MSSSWDRLMEEIKGIKADIEGLKGDNYRSAIVKREESILARRMDRISEMTVVVPLNIFADAGAAPAAHHTTHENGGSDEITVLGLSGLLADAQTPLAHAASHQAGGVDLIKLDDLATPDDNTDLNVSTTRHGLTPKASGSATEFLNGLGAYATPSGTGAPTTSDYLVKTADAVLSAERVVTDTTSIVWDWATGGQAKATRAALTGDVTAPADSNTTTIAAGAVDQAMTSITGTPTGAKFLRDDWSWQTVTAAPSDGDKGDITVSASGATWTIDSAAVTFAKIQNLNPSTLIGRISGSGSGVSSEITASGALAVSAAGVLDVSSAGITYAKIQNLNPSTLIGRISGSGSGVSSQIDAGFGLEITAAGLLNIKQGAAIADATDAASAITQLNAVLARMRAATPYIAT